MCVQRSAVTIKKNLQQPNNFPVEFQSSVGTTQTVLHPQWMQSCTAQLGWVRPCTAHTLNTTASFLSFCLHGVPVSGKGLGPHWNCTSSQPATAQTQTPRRSATVFIPGTRSVIFLLHIPCLFCQLQHKLRCTDNMEIQSVDSNYSLNFEGNCC